MRNLQQIKLKSKDNRGSAFAKGLAESFDDRLGMHWKTVRGPVLTAMVVVMPG